MGAFGLTDNELGIGTVGPPWDRTAVLPDTTLARQSDSNYDAYAELADLLAGRSNGSSEAGLAKFALAATTENNGSTPLRTRLSNVAANILGGVKQIGEYTTKPMWRRATLAAGAIGALALAPGIIEDSASLLKEGMKDPGPMKFQLNGFGPAVDVNSILVRGHVPRVYLPDLGDTFNLMVSNGEHVFMGSIILIGALAVGGTLIAGHRIRNAAKSAKQYRIASRQKRADEKQNLELQTGIADNEPYAFLDDILGNKGSKNETSALVAA